MSKPFNTALIDGLVALGAPRPCFKHGYASEGAAWAHVRSLQRQEERKPDRKNLSTLTVYYCHWRGCRKLPWHAGHVR